MLWCVVRGCLFFVTLGDHTHHGVAASTMADAAQEKPAGQAVQLVAPGSPQVVQPAAQAAGAASAAGQALPEGQGVQAARPAG